MSHSVLYKLDLSFAFFAYSMTLVQKLSQKELMKQESAKTGILDVRENTP